MFKKNFKKQILNFTFIFSAALIFVISITFNNISHGNNNNPLIKIFSTNDINEDSYDEFNLLSNIDDFVKVPKGGIHWKVFGETLMKEYTFFDK